MILKFQNLTTNKHKLRFVNPINGFEYYLINNVRDYKLFNVTNDKSNIEL